MSYRLRVELSGADVHFADDSVELVDGGNVIFIQSTLLAVESIEDVYRALSISMKFPPFFNENLAAYGANLDSLYDCISDMSWLPASAYVLALSESLPAWKRFPLEMGQLTNAWLDAASFWRAQAVPFKLFFAMND